MLELDGSAQFVEGAEVPTLFMEEVSDPTAFYFNTSSLLTLSFISVTLLAWMGLNLVRNVSGNFINSSWNSSQRLSMEIFMKKESWTNLELAQPVKEGHLVEERMS